MLLLLTRAAALSLVLFPLAATAVAQPAPRAEWTVPFGSFSQPAGLSGFRDGSVLFAYTSTPCERVFAGKTAERFYNRLGVAKVDPGGNVVFDVEVPRPREVLDDPRPGPAIGLIGGVAALADGDFLVVAEFIEGRPWLLRFDGKGALLYSKPIPGGGRTSILTATRSADGDGIVIGGRAGTDFFVAQFASNGRPVWEKSVNGGHVDVVVDLVADADGSVVAAGVSMPASQGMHGRSDVVVMRIDKSGELAAERRFPGRFPSIASSGNEIALAFDRGQALEASVRLKTFDRALVETSEVVIPAISPMPHVAADPAGSFVVLALGENGAIAAGVARRGASRWQTATVGLPMSGEYRVLSAGRALYATTSSTVQEEGRACVRTSLSRVSFQPVAAAQKGTK